MRIRGKDDCKSEESYSCAYGLYPHKTQIKILIAISRTSTNHRWIKIKQNGEQR